MCPSVKSAKEEWNNRATPELLEASKALLVRLYNAGYKAGHHDTVEGQYTDIFEVDMDSYHENVVAEILEETGDTRPAPELPGGYRVFRKHLLRRVGTEESWTDILVKGSRKVPEIRVADIDAEGRLWVRTPIEPEEIQALIAFLQGAR
jgi:hypothetical protein